MSFKDGRIGVGKDPIFPLDISGSCRIDGDLILGGRFSDSQGNAIQLGSGSGAVSTPDQTSSSLPSWQGGTITTQGLGVFKGKMDSNSIYITGDNTKPTGLNGGNYNCTLGINTGQNITSGDANILIGYGAGSSTTTHNSNIAIGMQALYTSPAVRNYCIGIGHQALYSWNGDMNTAIGYVAAQYCHGAYNTAVGGLALQGNSSAQGPDYSVAVGYQAGRYQGESDYNIWIGAESGPQTIATIGSQTGDENIGIGHSALNKVTSGRNNVCIGYKSGEVLTTGQYNTCVGADSGINITSAESNTTIGAYCAPNITTGNYNTIMGVNAGYNLTTGTNNTCIGMEAGFSQNAYTRCVLLGYGAMAYGTSNVTGTIAIGFQAGYREGSGNRNIYIGQQTGPQTSNSSRTCAENVVMGYQCGYYLTTGNYNTLIGRSAGHAITDGDYNICLGYYAAVQANSCSDTIIIGRNAGYSIIAANDTIAIGQSALAKITNAPNSIGIGNNAGFGITGGQNICIGHNVAYNTTSNTGHNNVFMGQVTAYSLTSGYENVCIGREVGYYLTTGFRNIFMGTYAGYASSSAKNTGSYNVGIGYNALRYVSSGTENICIGYGCGESITSGQRNVCLGRTAAQSITTGGYNVCIGMNTGDSITTANSNVFIGYQAGEKITTHAANTFIGAQAGCYMTSGYNNVCIGHYAGAGSGGGNYELYINSYVGSYGTDSFIYGNMNMSSNPYLRLNAKLGIGTSSPKFPLDVDDSNTSTDMTYWNRSTQSSTRADDGAYFSTASDGTRSGSNYGQSEIGDLDSGTTYPSASIGNFNIAAHFKNGVYISDGALYVSSDRRIKTNIVDVKDNLALEMVRNIPCRYYNYNDKLSRGTNATIGFIAQEVKEIYPRAVVERTQFIPNEMRNLNDLRWNDTTLFTDLSDCSGITYRFYVGNDPSGNDEIRKDIIGNSDNSFTFDTSYNNVFCYGKEVDDFHTLDKNKLFALNFSATQELDRKVTALETVGNQDHNVKILDLYKENEALKARLAKIEAFLGI